VADAETLQVEQNDGEMGGGPRYQTEIFSESALNGVRRTFDETKLN
jgi:hypothetical protein